MFRRLFLPALLIVLAGAAGAWALSRRGREPIVPRVERPVPRSGDAAPRAPEPPTEPDPPFALLVGGEMEGRFLPPPCSRTGQGGLPRIAAVVGQMSGATPLGILVDTGDLAGAPGGVGAVEYEVALTVLRELGLAVSALGEKDLLLGLERWRKEKNEHGEGVAILCANLRDAEGRELLPAVAGFRLGRRKVVVGAVLSPSFEAGLRARGVDVRLLDPAESVRKAFRAAGDADLRVLLSHCPEEESRALAAALPEVHLVVTAHAGDLPTLEPERDGDRAFIAAGSGWQWVTGLVYGALEGKPSLLDHAVRAVGVAVEPVPVFGLHVEDAHRRMRRPGLLEGTLEEAARALPSDDPLRTGPQTCASCHPAAHEAWSREEDPHFRSMAGVRKVKMDGIYSCLPCHATAPGTPGGHLAPGDAQARVTCEACHGPGGAHAAADGRSPLANARDACATCHTPEMSPGFDFEDRWPRVFHGR